MNRELAPTLQRRISLIAVLTAALAAAVLFLFAPDQYAFYPHCVLYTTTGLQCPACGGLRATHELLHGHLAAAYRLNRFFILLLPLLAWWGAAQLLGWHKVTRSFQHPLLWGTIGVAALVFGVLRNL